jgi:membrane protease YdiL (CAAX protease family)
VFIQAGGEELFFRGYVMQRLAARYRNPIVWALLPSVAFGALHFFNGVSLEHSIYYVISTAIFGATAAAIVWRTGDLSAAIGLHVATNVIAFLVSGTDDFFTATPLWLWPVETSIAAMPSTIVLELLLLGFVLWGPFPGQPRARRNVIRAAP